jgi:hypothetical protein
MADQSVPERCVARLERARVELIRSDARFRSAPVRRTGERIELSLQPPSKEPPSEAYLAYLAPSEEPDSDGWQYLANKAYSGWDTRFRRVAHRREAWVGARGPQEKVRRFIDLLRAALDDCFAR